MHAHVHQWLDHNNNEVPPFMILSFLHFVANCVNCPLLYRCVCQSRLHSKCYNLCTIPGLSPLLYPPMPCSDSTGAVDKRRRQGRHQPTQWRKLRHRGRQTGKRICVHRRLVGRQSLALGLLPVKERKVRVSADYCGTGGWKS